MILRSVLVMSIAAIAALSLTSCGKSKKELAAEAERKQAIQRQA